MWPPPNLSWNEIYRRLSPEKAMYAKGPPSSEGADRPKKEAAKSRSLVIQFNRELTYENMI